MDFDLSPEQLMLQQGAQRFVREQAGVPARRALAHSETGFRAAHWQAFADLGWLAMSIPEEAGGLGASDVELALLMKELGQGLSGESFPDTAILGATLIQNCADRALRDPLLASLTAGRCRTALAHVEPGNRSEYETDVSTRAVEHRGIWQIAGTKHRVIQGTSATHWLVSARLEDDAAPALFVVDATAAGVERVEYPLIDGTRACDLRFEAVPAALLLRPEQWPLLDLALDRTVVALAAAAVGSMEAVMAATAEHLRQRVQFGQPLSKFQALQHRMAEMFVETDQAHSMLYPALAALGGTDPHRRRQAVSGAKWVISRAGQFVVSQGIQLHGGVGITEEFAVSHHYKSMLVFDKRLGDPAFHLRRSAGFPHGPS